MHRIVGITDCGGILRSGLTVVSLARTGDSTGTQRAIPAMTMAKVTCRMAWAELRFPVDLVWRMDHVWRSWLVGGFLGNIIGVPSRGTFLLWRVMVCQSSSLSACLMHAAASREKPNDAAVVALVSGVLSCFAADCGRGHRFEGLINGERGRFLPRGEFLEGVEELGNDALRRHDHVGLVQVPVPVGV